MGARKVTLAKGDRVVVGAHLSEDLISTVTTAVTDGTTIATSPGTFRGHIANSADGAITDVNYSSSPKDLFRISNNEETLGVIVTEQADALTFQYVAQCSNRGFCNGDTGVRVLLGLRFQELRHPERPRGVTYECSEGQRVPYETRKRGRWGRPFCLGR